MKEADKAPTLWRSWRASPAGGVVPRQRCELPTWVEPRQQLGRRASRAGLERQLLRSFPGREKRRASGGGGGESLATRCCCRRFAGATRARKPALLTRKKARGPPGFTFCPPRPPHGWTPSRREAERGRQCAAGARERPPSLPRPPPAKGRAEDGSCRTRSPSRPPASGHQHLPHAAQAKTDGASQQRTCAQQPEREAGRRVGERGDELRPRACAARFLRYPEALSSLSPPLLLPHASFSAIGSV